MANETTKITIQGQEYAYRSEDADGQRVYTLTDKSGAVYHTRRRNPNPWLLTLEGDTGPLMLPGNGRVFVWLTDQFGVLEQFRPR